MIFRNYLVPYNKCTRCPYFQLLPITLDLSSVFCQVFSRFMRARCVEWSFLNPYNFGDKIFFGKLFNLLTKNSLKYF